MTPLSNRQKSTLSQLARRAYDHVGSTAAGPLPRMGDWRREEVRKACGRYGLTECENRHYNAVAAHFESLIGNEGRAFNHLLREQSDGLRQVRSVLSRALAAGDLPDEYAETIAIGKFGCPIDDLNEQQVWQIVYTVKGRVRSRQRNQKEAAAP